MFLFCQIFVVFVLGVSFVSQIVVVVECLYLGKVVFVGLNWESGMFIIDLLCYVLEKGYGCEIDVLLGNIVIMENVLCQNDIQVIGE